MSNEVVFVGIPSYDGNVNGSSLMSIQYASSRTPHMRAINTCSLLANGFNVLYCLALNNRTTNGLTHFCMLHADIVPIDHDWLDTMMDEMQQYGLKALSVAMPIKNEMGLTSTALDMSHDRDLLPNHTWPARRLTIREISRMPETFTAADAVKGLAWWKHTDDPTLLINTGLLLIDIRESWAEQLCFTINDSIVKLENGQFCAFVEPEDWNLSKQLKALGVPYGVTRKVRCNHVGSHYYANDLIRDTSLEIDPVILRAVEGESAPAPETSNDE